VNDKSAEGRFIPKVLSMSLSLTVWEYGSSNEFPEAYMPSFAHYCKRGLDAYIFELD
jgi:hypothetical protein